MIAFCRFRDQDHEKVRKTNERLLINNVDRFYITN
jgi:hypothetical protein